MKAIDASPSLAVLALTLGLMGCLTDPNLDRTWQQEAGYRSAHLSVLGLAPGFEAIDAEASGIDFVNTLRMASALDNNHYFNGSGVALGDVDGDGWTDVYLARLDGSNALYRNLGGWVFEDITGASGTALAGRYAMGATFADVDGDGDLDLLVTAMGGPNALMLNDGNGRFTEATEAAGLSLHMGSMSMALADVDGDGDLDLYVVNYKTKAVNDLYAPDERSYDKTLVTDGETFAIAPAFQEHFELEVRPDGMVRLEYAEPDRFYLNDGTGHFSPVPFTEGAFLDEDGQPLAKDLTDWGLAVRFQDVNGDGHPDLYVCNDYHTPDRLWLGDGKGRFRAAPREALRKTSLSTMAVDFSDIERDGDLDFFLADMRFASHQERQQRIGDVVPKAYVVGEYLNRTQEVQNALQVNRGDDTFAELAFLSGVAATGWTWSSIFMDVDLDGYEDLLLTNGHAYDLQNADAQEREMATLSTMRDLSGFRELIQDYPTLPLANVAFRNRGDRTFEAMPEGWGLGAVPDVALSMAHADLDHDGDLDVVINRLNERVGLFRNTSPASRIAVRLIGRGRNAQAIGATITVRGGPVAQTKEVISGGQYLAGSDPLYAFATGEADSVNIEVQWRSGARTVLNGLPANRVYEIDEPAERPTSVASAPAAQEPVYFEDRTDALDHRHHEPFYDDFARQPLLPQRLSQRGPPVAWADVDADGDDDLLIGSGRGGMLAYYRNDGGRLSPMSTARLGPAEGDQVGLAVWPRTDGAAVFIAVSNFERGPRDASYILHAEIDRQGAIRPRGRLDFGAAAIGALALADVDGDGTADLLATGHHLPGQYGQGVGTRIYRGEGRDWAFDDARSAPFADLGMASDATFGDLDADGDPDLVVATEWGAVRVWMNDGAGQYTEATATIGLDAYTGWWHAIALADFDGDGRLDIAAANEGWNTPYGPWHQQEQPLHLYASDFDANGVADVLTAQYDPDLQAYVPDQDLGLLSQVMPYVRSRMPTFAQYATSPIDRIIGPKLQRAVQRAANTLTSMVFLQRPGGAWEALNLPQQAQWAPAMDIVAADYDRDGRQDLFLSQNFFGVPDDVPRRDAGRGLLLLGDGRGGFAAVPGPTAGLMVYGEGRGAAATDYDRDGHIDLVVTQNGAETRLFRNKGGGS